VQRALGSDSIGARRTLEILRGGTVLHLEATVGERPHDE
jgi:S1-C subfamily serine protease